MKKSTIPKLWLIIVWDDVSAEVMGPYKNAETRLRAARKLRRDEGDGHGLYRLDVQADGTPETFDFSGREVEG